MCTLETAMTAAAPVVSYAHVAHTNFPTSGTGSITIYGLNFVSRNFSPTAALVGGVCTSTSWITETSLLCDVRGFGSNLRWVVILSRVSGTSGAVLTFDSMPPYFLRSKHQCHYFVAHVS